MTKRRELINQQFGRLLVLQYAGYYKDSAQWLCQCKCGNLIITTKKLLVNDHTHSCGCYRKEITGLKYYKHGASKHPLYTRWHNMKSRCYRLQHPDYHLYGARGITVCDDWRKDFKPYLDWCLTHGYGPGLKLDRINNDGPYSPSNCRFVTNKVNMNNTRVVHKFPYDQQLYTISELADQFGLNREQLAYRLITRKLSVEDSIRSMQHA